MNPKKELPWSLCAKPRLPPGQKPEEPVILNVKGLGYKIHASLAIEAVEPTGSQYRFREPP